MRRRTFLCGGICAALVVPAVARAQPGARVPSIGYVTSSARTVNVDAFEQGLVELGYAIGQNIAVQYRFADGRVDRVPALVDDLVRLRPDVLVATSPHTIRAARQATGSIPIVGIDLETDPVEVGWARSWASPGGNVTGFFLSIPELSGKHLQFLAEVVPRLQRIAVLWDAAVSTSQFKATEAVAQTAKLALQSLAFQQESDFASALEAARQQRAQALVVLSSPTVFRSLKRLAELTILYRLPAISVFPQFADAGGLMGYGPNLTDLFRQAASYADRILKGARPADLPLQRPTVFRLVVNMKTSKTLGLTIPTSVVSRADQVIW